MPYSIRVVHSSAQDQFSLKIQDKYGGILISDLIRLAPDAVTLKYETFQVDNDGFQKIDWKSCRIIDNWIQPPPEPNGWFFANLYHCCVIPKEDNDLFITKMSQMKILDSAKICPQHQVNGYCLNQSTGQCEDIHGDFCDVCGQYSLHPFSESQRENHIKQCIAVLEGTLEEEKHEELCSICLDDMSIKQAQSRVDKMKRFGILKNCRHVFCFECIDAYRLENRSRSVQCPLCRVISHSIYRTTSMKLGNE